VDTPRATQEFLQPLQRQIAVTRLGTGILRRYAQDTPAADAARKPFPDKGSLLSAQALQPVYLDTDCYPCTDFIDILAARPGGPGKGKPDFPVQGRRKKS
jgi:hypothetical protein